MAFLRSYAIDATRLHQTRPWVVLFSNLSAFRARSYITHRFELAFVSAVGWTKNYDPFPNKYTGLFITNWTVNLLFIVDIVFNFLTAVYDPQLNKWLLRFDQIALHYARGWMTLDIVSMLPVEYMIKSKQAFPVATFPATMSIPLKEAFNFFTISITPLEWP